MADLKISTVTVYVSTQERALPFYRDKLGFEVRMDAPMGSDARWLTVAPPGSQTQIALMPVESEAGKEWDWRARMGRFTGIIFETDDAAASYRELSGRGVPFDGEPQQAEWGGIEVFFSDPDGNDFLLVQVAPAAARP